MIVHGITAGRLPPWRGLGAAVLAWLVAALAAQQVGWTPWTALAANLHERACDAGLRRAG